MQTFLLLSNPVLNYRFFKDPPRWWVTVSVTHNLRYDEAADRFCTRRHARIPTHPTWVETMSCSYLSLRVMKTGPGSQSYHSGSMRICNAQCYLVGQNWTAKEQKPDCMMQRLDQDEQEMCLHVTSIYKFMIQLKTARDIYFQICDTCGLLTKDGTRVPTCVYWSSPWWSDTMK